MLSRHSSTTVGSHGGRYRSPVDQKRSRESPKTTPDPFPVPGLELVVGGDAGPVGGLLGGKDPTGRVYPKTFQSPDNKRSQALPA